ncbi:1-aminocyclopropane-1-carboxylate deaminase/D-cysteine desulfhydrase [Glaciimonas sp. PCH181]|uniref:1-aminocyclopropane-1-carboxylate deaminase/D-cysteine desulfhydrase n=1 Tax=Glaciimonas sp. PCH181 TaxID=2133943 RepID=UPI000D39B0C2|nr:pyridoxal-phosphate dependent enzyme [Glaciimonas sp. PCH181]PUA18776.1 1-aminocyclopropane-1-carboxylate deaminase [Glaciimonas sp. PCH181]
MDFPSQPSPCQYIPASSFWGQAIWIKRDDLLHPTVSGNKFRKLKYPLLALRERQREADRDGSQKITLTTMGGPWSNHLHALAHAGALYGWPTHGLVRGPQEMHTATLDDCRRLGMRIQTVTRDEYRDLRDIPDAWRRHVDTSDINHAWFPEGGSLPEALHGVAEVIAELPFFPDVVMVACGTGATLAGLLAGMGGKGRVIGIAVLKNAGYLHQEIATLLQQAGYPAYKNYTLITDAHHGGYGKAPAELKQFCHDFSRELAIPIEPVYTGKLFFALKKMVQENAFGADERIVAVHTGGLQGARGFTD